MLSILLGALLAQGTASSAAVLEGQLVRRGTAQAIANAEVSILGRPGVVQTDAAGRFTWVPAPAPPFEVLVSLPGARYMKPVVVERLPVDGALLVLEVAPLLEESVTVIGGAPRIDTAPASGATLVAAREIEVRQPANLTQLLENVAGVSTVSEGYAAVPAIRGLARGRTLILIDGARVTSERRVGPSATFLDPFVLDAVEVARGPGSVAYGSDALGGVIYARTRRVAPGSPLRGRVLEALGTGIPEARFGVEVSRGLERGGVLFQTHGRLFSDVRSPHGDVLNSGASDGGFLLRGEHAVGAGWLSIGWQSDLGRDIERPRTNANVVRFYYPAEDSHRLTASYERGPAAGFRRLTLSGFLGRYALVTDQDTYATATKPRSIERADVRSNDFQVRGSVEKLVGPSQIELGIDLSGRYGLRALDRHLAYDLSGRLESTTTSVSIDTAHRTDLGAYLIGQLAPAPRLSASAGLRGDRVTATNAGGYFGDRAVSHGAASGFLSLTAGPLRGLTLAGQISRGFRDPMLSDRYYRGPTGRGYITGNPDLESETSLQLDLAIRRVGGRYRWAGYVYQYRIDHLVERYETEDDFFHFRNRGRARLRGVELEAQAELGRGLSLELEGQIARGEALDDAAPLDDIPAESVSLQVRRQLGARAFAQLRGAAYARDDRPGPTEVAVPGYAIVDIGAGYRVSDALELGLQVRNLFDQAYPLSPDPRGVYAPGTSVLATVAAQF